MEKKYAAQKFKALSVDRENFTIRFVMSTNDVDRHGEVVDQKGWNFTNFLSNPVVLWGHDQSLPAVGKVIELSVINGQTEGLVQFAYKQNPMAAMLFELYAEGFLSAVSVGFMNTKWSYDETTDLLTLLENELYELSLVNVPANARALAKSKGINLEPLDAMEAAEKLAHNARLKAMTKDTSDLGEEVKPEAETIDITTDEETEEERLAREAAEAEAAEEANKAAVKAAIEVLLGSTPTVLKSAVAELTSALEDTNKEVGTTPSTGRVYKVDQINHTIRSLMQGTAKQ